MLTNLAFMSSEDVLAFTQLTWEKVFTKKYISCMEFSQHERVWWYCNIFGLSDFIFFFENKSELVKTTSPENIWRPLRDKT